MSKYKIAVSPTVLVPVEGSLADANGVPQPFKLLLECKRQSFTEQREVANSLVIGEIPQFMKPLTTGWREQTLVLNGDGTPADFNDESFQALLDIGGMPQLVYNAYTFESGAKAKNS